MTNDERQAFKDTLTSRLDEIAGKVSGEYVDEAERTGNRYQDLNTLFVEVVSGVIPGNFTKQEAERVAPMCEVIQDIAREFGIDTDTSDDPLVYPNEYSLDAQRAFWCLEYIIERKVSELLVHF